MDRIVVVTVEELESLVERAVRRAMGERPTLGELELTSEQAAKELGLAPKTLRRMAREGRIPGKRQGQQWRFTREAITAYKEYGDANSIRNLARVRVAKDLAHLRATRNL